MENLDQIVEAIIFSAGNIITKKDILSKLPDEVSRKDLNKAIRHLAKRYSGKSGIHLTVMENEVQFTSNPDYGDIVADVLRVTKEKELSKVLLEVLSIVAYKGPITKTQIEDIRNTNSEYAVNALCRFNLIYPCGRADTLGRPTLYKTTHEFLQKFGLKSLDELPSKDEVLQRLKDIGGEDKSDTLFRDVDLDNLDDILNDDEDLEERIEEARKDFVDTYMNTEELPDFLKDEENVQVVGDDDEESESEDEENNSSDENYDDTDDSDFDDVDEEDDEETEDTEDIDSEDDYVETSSIDDDDDDFDDDEEESGDDDFDDDDDFGKSPYDN